MAEVSGSNILDIENTIKGLKAIQREAKGAVKSLKESKVNQPNHDFNNEFTFKHNARYLVVDLGKPTGEEVSITMHCPTKLKYLTDVIETK